MPRTSYRAAVVSPPCDTPLTNPSRTNPVKAANGQKSAPRWMGTTTRALMRWRMRPKSNAAMQTSSGVTMAWSERNSIDSWLEKFLVNGYHADVAGSPKAAKAIAADKPIFGRTTHVATTPRKIKIPNENGCGAVERAIAANNPVPRMQPAPIQRDDRQCWRRASATLLKGATGTERGPSIGLGEGVAAHHQSGHDADAQEHDDAGRPTAVQLPASDQERQEEEAHPDLHAPPCPCLTNPRGGG